MQSLPSLRRLNPETLVDSRQFGFSQAVVVPVIGKQVFISGQYGGTRDGQVVEGGMVAQMAQSFANLKAAIEASGARPEHVTMIRVLIVNHQEAFLAPLHAEVEGLFGEHLPASTLIPVPRLALDEMLFEIEATLFVPA